MAFLQAGDADMAEQVCGAALEQFPDDANFLCLSARALIQLKNYDDAHDRLDRATLIFPEFARPYEVRGELLLKQQQPQPAVENFEKAISLDPKRASSFLKLSKALAMSGRMDEARQAVSESARLDPARGSLQKAAELVHAGEHDKAEKIYRKVLTDDPDNVDALRLLAEVAATHKEYRDAEIFLKRAVERAPDFAHAWANLVIAQIELEKNEDAIRSAERLVALTPERPDALLLLANSCASAGRHDEALLHYQKVIEIAPTHAGALSSLGHTLKTVGRQEEAIEVYRRCIRDNPNFTEPYWSLANFKTFRFEDEEVAAMESLLGKQDLSDESQVQLCNALGLELESRQDYDRAFGYFERGNKIRRQAEYYDPVESEGAHERNIEIFSQEFLQQHAGRGDQNPSPIFIVGLPRSGSTLIEQVLASHPQVEGTHELAEVGRTIRDISRILNKKARYPQVLQSFDASNFASMGENYIARTRKFRGGRKHFTDKNPNNYLHIGLLSLILPNAKIINARRHPLDSCFGSYKQLFAKGQPFSYDLVELGEYYTQYQRIMDHWHDVLPGHVLDVHYEDVVDDLETQVRRILQHCDLPWDDQCLRYYETGRAVKTASSEQVRKPIYKTSVNLWRHYEAHLEPLIEILEPLLKDMKDADRPKAISK